jgi:hypothetical protein
VWQKQHEPKPLHSGPRRQNAMSLSDILFALHGCTADMQSISDRTAPTGLGFAATCLNVFQTNYTVLRHTSSPADAGGTITSFLRALCMPESGAEEACMWMLTDTAADHDCQKRSAGGVPQGKRTTRKPRGRESRSVTLTTHKLLITGYIEPNHHFHIYVFQKEILWMCYIVLCVNVSTRIRNTK